MSSYSCRMVMAIARSGLVVAAAVAATACMSSSGDDGSGGDDDTCGNHVCDPGESMSSCPEDCHAVGSGSGSGTCGNHVCDAGETPTSCPQDCPAPPPDSVCGNHVCEAGETQTSCAADCTATLVTVNNSSHTILTLHVYACTDQTEGPDWLGTNVLSPGFRFTLDHIPPGCFLFHATSGDGLSWRTPTGVNLVAAEMFTWTLSN